MGHYQLYRLNEDGQRTKVVDVRGASDGAAMAEALPWTENGASFVFCEGDREIAVIDVNDNRFLHGRHHPPETSRPAAIRSFELLFIAALAIGIIHAAIGWRGLSGQLPESFQAIFAILVVLAYCLFVALCVLISRRRSVVSMWALLALFALGALMTLRNVLDGRTAGLTPIWTFQFCAELIALALLFTPSSRLWMRRGG